MKSPRNRNKARFRRNRNNNNRFMRKSWNRCRKGHGLRIKMKPPNGYQSLNAWKQMFGVKTFIKTKNAKGKKSIQRVQSR